MVINESKPMRVKSFRETHAFVTPDGRRFTTLACAGHSIVTSGERGNVIEETLKNGTWHQATISYEAARMAYETAPRYAVS